MSADIVDLSRLGRPGKPVDEISQFWLDRLPPYIVDIVRAQREQRSQVYGAKPISLRDPLTVADVAAAASELADLAWHAALELGRERRRRLGRTKTQRSVPDSERPWDYRDGDCGWLVSEEVEHRLKEAQLCLQRNAPDRAVEVLGCAACLIKDGMKRAKEIKARAARAAAEEKRRERQRRELEVEERRLARERERVRRKIEAEGSAP